MLHLNTKQQRQPYGGHHYKDHGVMFRGDTFKQVREKVRIFRINNAIPLGNPDQDILMFYAKNFPWMVVSDETAIKPEDVEFGEWRDWVSKTWKTPPIKLITPKEASTRWEVCRTCPLNKDFSWKESDESSKLTRMTFQMRRGVTVPAYLKNCSCHKADLSVFSFIEDSAKYSALKEGIQPTECWVGKSVSVS